MRLRNCRYICSTGGRDTDLFPEGSTLECLWNQGFYSNMTQTFSSLLILLHYGIEPERISYEHGFEHFKTNPREDIFPYFHLPIQSNVQVPLNKRIHVPSANVVKQQRVNYDFESYSLVLKKFFTPSISVANKIQILTEKYTIEPAQTIAVLYRGTDKHTEVKLASREKYLGVVRALLEKHPDCRVLLQTDDGPVLDYCMTELGEKAFHFDETPTTHENRVVWSLMSKYDKGNILEWAQWFDAALRIVSCCKYVVNHTGNVALFQNLYRGSLEGVFQFDEYGELMPS